MGNKAAFQDIERLCRARSHTPSCRRRETRIKTPTGSVSVHYPLTTGGTTLFIELLPQNVRPSLRVSGVDPRGEHRLMQPMPSPAVLRFQAKGKSPQPPEDSFYQICGKVEGEAKLTAPVSKAQLVAPTARAHKRPAATRDSREKLRV